MNSFNNKLNSLFVLLYLACCVALFADASLSTGLFEKVAELGSGVKKELEKVKEPLKKTYDAYDLAGKATDQMDCSSEFCTKFRNYPDHDHPLRCAGCVVKTLTHPIKDNDP